MTDDIANPHPWFTIDGLQTGRYALKDRLFALNAVRDKADGASVLDLGCAEGLLSKWLADQCGAKTIHGIDKYEPYVAMARNVMRGYDAAYWQADFCFFTAWLERFGGELLPGYDIVLALRVAQKIARPVEFVRTAARLAKGYFVIQVPCNASGVMVDRRSRNIPVDMKTILGKEFALIDCDVRPMHVDHEFTGTFQRVVG